MTMMGACISGNSYSVVSSPPYVLARLSPDRAAGQFHIWDRIGRVDGCVSVFKIVDVDGRWNRGFRCLIPYCRAFEAVEVCGY